MSNVIKIIILLFLSALVSCVPQRKLLYLQDIKNSTVDTITKNPSNRFYILKPNDDVFLSVYSSDPKTSEIFNVNTSDNSNSKMYTISDSGYIQLPIAGKIQIAGLTANEAKAVIEKTLQKYIIDVNVNFRLAEFSVTILGEFGGNNRKGVITTHRNQLNILEAIALSGDITTFGDHSKVMIVREVNGRQTIKIVNVLDKNILYSDDFYLLPNDLIYVRATPAKIWGFEKAPYSLVFGSLSFVLSLMTLIKVF